MAPILFKEVLGVVVVLIRFPNEAAEAPVVVFRLFDNIPRSF